MLPHPDVRSELRARGVCADLADAMIEAGVLHRVDDELLVLTFDVDEISSMSQVLGTLLAAEGEIEPELVRGVIDLAVSQHASAQQLVLSIPGSRVMPDVPTGRPFMRYVAATDELALREPAPGWQIRSAVASDAADVVPLYVAAFIEGYALAGSPAGHEEARMRSQTLFQETLANGAVFVATGPNGFAGHATVTPDQDDLTGQPRLELFDVFVLPRYCDTPAGGLLTSAAVQYARERGLVLRGYVSGHDHKADRILESLLVKGWRQDRTYWLIHLQRNEDRDG